MQNSLQILNHIEELKYRCSYFLLSFFLSLCSLYFFLGESTYILIYPLLQDLKNQINFLIYTDISEAFFASLKLTFFFAFFFSIPNLIYHFYFFILPGTYEYEKRGLLKYIISSYFIMLITLFLSYIFIIPFIWTFFLNYDFNLNKELFQLTFQGKILEYINFILRIFLGFIIAFQLPIFLITLIKLKVLSTMNLKKYRSLNIIFSFILGALLSPPDVLSQIMIAFPLCCIYEISIFYGLFINNKDYYL